MKKQRLTIENRILIEELVKLKYKLKHIAEIIEVDKSTISRELKKRRITGKGIYKECKLTTRFPYVCNGCDNRIKCRKKKYYYHYDKAQKHYDYILKTSRTGIDMSIDELYYSLKDMRTYKIMSPEKVIEMQEYFRSFLYD